MSARRLEADRSAPAIARDWVGDTITAAPLQAREAELLVSELVGRAVAAGVVDEVAVDARRLTTTWEVSVSPVPEPDELTTRMLTRFSAGWAGPDPEGVLWFEVRTPGAVDAALADRSLDELLAVVDEDAEARDEVVRRLTPMATTISRRYRGKGIGDADLEQAAVLGLLRALDRYDPEAGVFERYAAKTVSGEMKRLLRDRAWSVRVPRGVKQRSLEVGRAHQELAQRLGRPPKPAEVAEELDLDVDEVVEAMGVTSAYRSASIDAPAAGTGRTVGDTLGADDRDMELVEWFGDLGPAVADIEPREREILRLRFVDELTQSEIAERVGVSQMHVSRLLRSTLADLRDRLD